MALTTSQRAILFADVADSTAIYEKLGDSTAVKSIDRCIAIMADAVNGSRGIVVKTIGDEIMAAFLTAIDACEAAKAMQEAISVLPVSDGVKHAIKIGFHFGSVLEDKQDFWGDGVNVAARLAGLARRGQILTSSVTVEALTPQLRFMTRDMDDHNVKGRQDAVRVFEVVWEEDTETTQLVVPIRRSTVIGRLSLSHTAATFDFPPDKGVLWLGRDAGCEMVIAEKSASRRHARIERRSVQYYLVDDSTNGTYVTIEGDNEVLLRREQLLLRGRGQISLGVLGAVASDPITFVFS